MKKLLIFLILFGLLIFAGMAYGSGEELDGIRVWKNAQIIDADIDGGTIDGVTIGGTTPAAGSFTDLIIIPSATKIIAIDLQGDTNDYTGATAGFGMKIARDVNRGTDAIPNYAGWQSYLNVKHTDATISGDRFAYGNITRIDQSGKITNAGEGDRQYWNVGAHNTSKITGDFDTDSTGVLNVALIGTYSWVWAEGYDILDESGGGPANTFAAYGIQSYVQHLPDLNDTAAGTFTSAGIYVSEVEANTEGTSTAYGIYIGAVGGADTNYGLYEASGQDSLFEGSLFVAGLDASSTMVGLHGIFTGTDIASDNISGAQARNGTIIFANEGGAVDWNMPGAFAGASLRVKVTTAHTATLDSTTDDVIHLIDGTALDANDAIDLAAQAGAYIWMVAYDTTNWWVMAQVGAIADGGAD